MGKLVATWKEMKAADGRAYLLNEATDQSFWKGETTPHRADKTTTPKEGFDATVWNEYTNTTGRNHLYNEATEESIWKGDLSNSHRKSKLKWSRQAVHHASPAVVTPEPTQPAPAPTAWPFASNSKAPAAPSETQPAPAPTAPPVMYDASSEAIFEQPSSAAADDDPAPPYQAASYEQPASFQVTVQTDDQGPQRTPKPPKKKSAPSDGGESTPLLVAKTRRPARNDRGVAETGMCVNHPTFQGSFTCVDCVHPFCDICERAGHECAGCICESFPVCPDCAEKRAAADADGRRRAIAFGIGLSALAGIIVGIVEAYDV